MSIELTFLSNIASITSDISICKDNNINNINEKDNKNASIWALFFAQEWLDKAFLLCLGT